MDKNNNINKNNLSRPSVAPNFEFCRVVGMSHGATSWLPKIIIVINTTY